MTPLYAIVAISVLNVGYVTSSHADSWSITQNVLVSTNTSASQQNATSSVQAFNSINLDSTNGVVTKSDQLMHMNGNDLTMTQTGGTGSRQAVNIISAANVTEGTQTLTGADAVILAQNSGTNNLQVINAVITSGSGVQIETLNQSLAVNTLTFSHQGGGNSNIQAGNYIEAEVTNPIDRSLTQSFNVTTLNYIQDGTNNTQAGNILVKKTSYSGGLVEQNFNADTINISLPATLGNGSVAAGNLIIER